MKNFLTRICRKIFRFFWSWGFLKFILIAITLIIFLYVEEDWRGARAWATTKAKWEAKGESFDPKTYYPRPVPDDQNLAALPIFKQEPDPANSGELLPLKLNEALNQDHHGGSLPPGHVSPEEFRADLAAAYAHLFPGTTPPADPVAQFDALYPIIPDLKSAMAGRPIFQIKQDYSAWPPWKRGLALLTKQIALSQMLGQHARVAMADKKPDIALEDIKLKTTLAEGVARDPSVVEGLVSIGITAIGRDVIDNGLQAHAWNDAQLADLQNQLARVDFLSVAQLSTRGEIVCEIIPNFDYLEETRSVVLKTWVDQGNNSREDQINKAMVSPYGLWPKGWLTQNKTKVVDFLFRKLADVDPKERRIFPANNQQLERESDAAQALPWQLAPWNILFAVASPSLIKHTLQIAQIQVHLDEDRIVCALERYRLAHGAYPGSLDALAPAYIDELPHDIMNGQPYHYQLHPDGTFLLYSVGWNQTDDGGKVIYKKDGSILADYTQGDWPWPESPLHRLK